MKTKTFFEVRVEIPARHREKVQDLIDLVNDKLGLCACVDYYSFDGYNGEIVWEHLAKRQYDTIIKVLGGYTL